MKPLEPIDLYAYVAASLQETMRVKLADRAQKQKAGDALMRWLRDTAKKRPVPDLETRIECMRVAVDKMVDNMCFVFDDGKIVIKTNGSDEDTLKAFRLGTSWFEPNPDLIETILTGLFDE